MEVAKRRPRHRGRRYSTSNTRHTRRLTDGVLWSWRVRAGDIVLKRSIYRGNVRWTFPHRYVGEWDGRRRRSTAAPATRARRCGAAPEGYLKRWADRCPAVRHDLRGDARPSLRAGGARHSIEIYWDIEWNHFSWYVNLQTPVVVERAVRRHHRSGTGCRPCKPERRLELEGRGRTGRGGRARHLDAAGGRTRSAPKASA